MSEVQRWEACHDEFCIDDAHVSRIGEWVKFSDHEQAVRAAVSERDARIKELEAIARGVEETVGSFGYHLECVEYSGSEGDVEDLEATLDDAEKLADLARSLLSVDPNTEKEARS